jgi:hypothetical protein
MIQDCVPQSLMSEEHGFGVDRLSDQRDRKQELLADEQLPSHHKFVTYALRPWNTTDDLLALAALHIGGRR